MTTNKQPISKHPLIVALFSGILLAIIGYLFDFRLDANQRAFVESQSSMEKVFNEKQSVRDLKILEQQSKINEFEKYLDEFSSGSTAFYSAVENYILNQKIPKGKVLNSIEELNYKRAPLFATIKKIDASQIARNVHLVDSLAKYYLLVLDITEDCQKAHAKSISLIRKKLDERFTPLQNWIISELHKELVTVRKSKKIDAIKLPPH